MPRRGVNLTEDQWATVKAHAARRRQTISQFFADVLADLGMDGRPKSAVTTRMKPEPDGQAYDDRMREGLHDITLHEVSIVEDTQGNRDAGAIPIPAQPGKASSIGYSRPAPKPKAKK